jgi:hypothetical protein
MTKTPHKVKYYKDDWCLGAWRHVQQAHGLKRAGADEYKKKVRACEGEKERYNTLCELQFKKIHEIEAPTLEEREEQEDMRKHKANEEIFLAFASIHRKAKKQKHSRSLKNKENIKNKDVSIITD